MVYPSSVDWTCYLLISASTPLLSQFPDFIDVRTLLGPCDISTRPLICLSSIQFLLGIYMVLLSVLFSMISQNTLKKLSKFKDHVTDERTIKNLFNKYDTDRSGSLDPDEFATLCKHELGCEGLDHSELVPAMMALDKDNSGTSLSLPKLLASTGLMC